jgi:hypothetical protein
MSPNNLFFLGNLGYITDTMRLVKIKYGRVDEVSYWVDLSLGQGDRPRGPFLRHVECMRWMGSRLNGNKVHDIQGIIVSHSWVPL